MAQLPTTATKQTFYRLKAGGGGIYKITYQAANGAHRAGIPHDDLTDLVNLIRVGGPSTAPAFIVTSEADFKASFDVNDPKQTATIKTQNQTVK